MIGLFATTVISCRDALSIISRIYTSIGLSQKQKIEVVSILKEYIPSCPIILKYDE